MHITNTYQIEDILSLLTGLQSNLRDTQMIIHESNNYLREQDRSVRKMLDEKNEIIRQVRLISVQKNKAEITLNIQNYIDDLRIAIKRSEDVVKAFEWAVKTIKHKLDTQNQADLQNHLMVNELKLETLYQQHQLALKQEIMLSSFLKGTLVQVDSYASLYKNFHEYKFNKNLMLQAIDTKLKSKIGMRCYATWCVIVGFVLSSYHFLASTYALAIDTESALLFVKFLGVLTFFSGMSGLMFILFRLVNDVVGIDPPEVPILPILSCTFLLYVSYKILDFGEHLTQLETYNFYLEFPVSMETMALSIVVSFVSIITSTTLRFNIAKMYRIKQEVEQIED